ncbi:MAG: hypothetical protein H6576_12030 [Lewinellaceae bacterium]|nr:hypothetical protein [Saprospiraceae bacterium]MCB9344420.1 hypothetical protein [Lewinellaceae bacterium]
MAQMNWIYLDDRGGRHSIGLYHGDRSGHMLIHCNRKIIQIDFSVKETKTYSFFVEDEFCEIIAERLSDGRFGYEFKVNKTVDTPRNRIRKVTNRRNNKVLAAFISGVVILIAVIFLGLRWYGEREYQRSLAITSIIHNLNKHNMQILAQQGKSCVASVYLDKQDGQNIGSYRFYTADSLEIQGTFQAKETLQNGFPTSAGGSFQAQYLPSDPQIHRVDLYRPNRKTLEQYIQIAFETEHFKNPELSKEKNLCRVLTVAETAGWTYLADIIYQDKSTDENSKNNRDSYLRLMRSGQIESAIKHNCWDE